MLPFAPSDTLFKPRTMVIRPLTISDAAPYRTLRLRAMREHAEAFTSSYEEEQRKPVQYTAQRLDSASPARYWGAFVADAAGGEDTMVGCVGLDREQRIKAHHKATVIGMYVAPEYARRGVARALLEALLVHARSTDLSLLVLTVTQGNTAAETLYGDVGFQLYGVEPNAIKVGAQYFAKNQMFMSLV